MDGPNLSKKVDGKFSAASKFAVLSIIILEYTISTTTPALGAIAQSMPDVDTVLIKQIQSLPSLTMMIVALIQPLFYKFIRRKKLLIIAAFIMLIGGALPGFSTGIYGNIYGILVCRALYGAGRGIIFPFAMAFIADLFEGKERDRMMGYRSASGNIAGIVFLQLGGFLAGINPRFSFYGVLLMIPFIVLIWIKLPEPEVENAELYERLKKEEAQKTEKKAKLQPKTWMMIILNMIFMFFAYSFITDIAIVVATKQLGNPSTTATIMTTFTVSSICMGLLFGRVIRPLFKRFTVCIGMIFIGLCALIIANVATLPGCFAGAVCFGIGFGIYNTGLYLDLVKTAHPSAAAQALSWFMAFNAFGQFISPNMLVWLTKPFGLVSELHGLQITGPALLGAGIVVIIIKAVKKPGIDYADQVLMDNEKASGASKE